MEAPPRQVKAKYLFKATNNDELCFEKGDIITVTQQVDGGWWEGTLNGKTGWFPSNYVVESKTDENRVPSPSVVAVDFSVKEQHHSLVTKHLVESEGDYFNDLQTLAQTYLTSLSTANIISTTDYSYLCGNLLELISFQKRFLQMLTECEKQPVSLQRVGGVFLKNASLLKTLYLAYAANHPCSVAVLAANKEALGVFMESQGATAPGSKTLTGHLSLPFRRLDKYPTLLKELERHIDDSHADRGDTQRAISIYWDIQNAAAEIRKDKEMELEVVSADIANWEGEELSSLGEVQLSAHVKMHSDGAPPSTDRIMLMFPTCILMISVSRDMSYSYEGKLMLAGLNVKKIEDNEQWSNALVFSGPMIDEMTVSFISSSKQSAWHNHISSSSRHTPADQSQQISSPKSVKSATMPPQATSKARVQNLTSSAKTAQVIESYDKLGAVRSAASTLCLRPLPPSRPQFMPRDSTKSPKVQRKASTLGRRKHNVDDSKILQEDAKILKVIEAYCTSVRTRHTVNSSILDSPNMLIAEDEKIICEVTKDNQTFIEEKSLVDTVYVIKDQIKDLQQEQQRLRRELEDERKARKKLESIVQKTLHSSRIPVPAMNQSGDCSA